MNLWRTTLFPGEETYAWHIKVPDGHLPVYRLGDEELTQRQWVTYPQWYTPSVQAAIRIPENTSPGDYSLEGIPVRIAEPARYRPTAYVSPGDNLQALLASGWNLKLAPGEYSIDTVLETWHEKLNAVIEGSGMGSTYLIANRHIRVSERLTIRDLTIRPQGYAFNVNAEVENVTLERVRFEGGEFGEWGQKGLIVRDCGFHCCGVFKLTGGLFHRCHFYRCGLNSRGARGLCWLECDFENGSVNFSSDGFSVQDSLFYGLQIHGLQGRDNGSEAFLVEAGQFNHNLVMGLRVRGGEGCALQFWDSEVIGNIFWDYALDGGGEQGRVIWFKSHSGLHEQSGNLFQYGELRGGRVDFGEVAKENRFVGVGMVSPRSGRGNQLSQFRPDYYVPQACFNASPDTRNLVEQWAIVDAPCGWQQFRHVEAL